MHRSLRSTRWLVGWLLVVGVFGSAKATLVPDVVISEVFYDRVGPDNGFEWVELFNGRATGVDLSDWSLGYGGTSVTANTVALDGFIEPGSYFVVGGPSSDASNANPIFDLPLNFTPDLQNSGATADVIALFDVPFGVLDDASLPIDVLIYGGANTSSLIDPDGLIAAVDFEDVVNGQSIERLSQTTWGARTTPNPNSGSLTGLDGPPITPSTPAVAEPSTLVLAGLGILALGCVRRREHHRSQLMVAS